MRIGMILDKEFPPDPRVENEARTLVDNGFEVFLFCLGFDNEKKIEHYNGMKVCRYQISPLAYKFSALAYTIPVYHFFMKFLISNFLKKNSIDVIHIHDMQIARAVFNIDKNIPCVLDLHENRPEIMKSYSHTNTFFGKLLINLNTWKKYEYKYIKMSANTIVVTQEAKAYYQSHISELSDQKIKVLPNTVRKSFYRDYKLDKALIDRFTESFTVLYLGDTGLRRGLMTAIQAMPLLLQSIPNIRLCIVGKNKTDYILKQKAEELGVQDVVDFEGWQPLDSFPSYITASDIGISPLHRNIHHNTTYANKLFQYLSFSKPIIVSDCDTQKNLVGNNNCGLVFKEKDKNEYANQVLRLYHDEQLRNQLGKNGKDFIEKEFNWEKQSQTLLTLYKNYNH